MINTMTAPVLWPALLRLLRRLGEARAKRREQRRLRHDMDRIPERLLRDVGLRRMPLGPPVALYPNDFVLLREGNR